MVKEEKEKEKILNGGELLKGMYGKPSEYHVTHVPDYDLNMRRLIGTAVHLYDAHKIFSSNVAEALSWSLEKPEESSVLKVNAMMSIESTVKGLEQLILLFKAYQIGPDSIEQYYESLLKERGIYETYMAGEPLATSFRYAVHCNIYDYQLGRVIRQGTKIPAYSGAFNTLTEVLLEHCAESYSELTFTVMSILSKLPSRESTLEHQKDLMVIWLLYIKYMSMVGFEAKDLYIQYEKIIKG